MPLPPSDDRHWPPTIWTPAYRKMREHSAWFAGDTDSLADVYGRVFSQGTKRPIWRFWARHAQNVDDKVRNNLHMPIASDIAATSSAILFSEAPSITVDKEDANNRLKEIIDESGLISTLLEAAEVAAALGGVYLRVSWDINYFNYPFLSVLHPDQMVPEFKWGKLQAVTKWDVVKVEGSTVWRHLERHEPGFILNGLYEGTAERLGTVRDLKAQPETEEFVPVVPLPDKSMMLVRYIPNMRPNRLWRTGALSHLGQSDYSGSESMMDALDEVWTSWIRDVRLARARLVVPQEFLKRSPGSTGPGTFDVDTEIFAPLDSNPRGGDAAIKGYQFDIRSEEHSRTALDLIERIITHAGYSPQSFGLNIFGRSESGTALRIRERKTFVTQQKKASYWTAGLVDCFQMMMEIDKWVMNNSYETGDVSVVISDSVSHDVGEVSEVVEKLHRAQAISTDTKIRMLHPEWDNDRVLEEVGRILNELGINSDTDMVFPNA